MLTERHISREQLQAIRVPTLKIPEGEGNEIYIVHKTKVAELILTAGENRTKNPGWRKKFRQPGFYFG